MTATRSGGPVRRAGELPLVLVSVGTDHHPFDRLVGWADRWALDRADRATVLVQHGRSAAPTFAQAAPFLDYAELQQAMGSALVVVTHGGPATITEARRHGKLPVAVSRDPARGEHVDGHQQRFVERTAAAGLVRAVSTEAELRTVLDRALDEPSELRLADAGPATEQSLAAARVADLLGGLVSASRRDLDRVPVLYIGGLGRSGSTLLERTLGQVEGAVCVGETVHLWERSLVSDERCGCGEPFSRCAFWTEVGQVAFGGWDRLDLDRLRRLRQRVDRTRAVPLLAAPSLVPGFARDLATYRRMLTRLYRAVRDVSGARLIIDSSKHASFAYVLRGVDGVDLRVLQVVRDSPAVAYSWSKVVERPESIPGDDPFMARWSPARTAVQWNTQNALVQALPGLGVPVHRARYEDFVRAPRETVEPVFDLLGLPYDEELLSMLDDGQVDLVPSHTVSGNPMRFRSGVTRIKPDESWRRGLPATDRRLVEGLTAPLRRWYGYPRPAPVTRVRPAVETKETA